MHQIREIKDYYDKEKFVNDIQANLQKYQQILNELSEIFRSISIFY